MSSNIEEKLLNPEAPEKQGHQKKVNPMDEVSIFSKVFFTWLTPLVKVSLKGSFEQKDHWPIYSYLKPASRLDEFQGYLDSATSVIPVIWKMFSFKWTVTVLTVIYNVFDIFDILMIYYLTQLLTYYVEHKELAIDMVKLGAYFAIFIVIEILKSTIVGIFDHIVYNEMVITRNCLIHSILRKSMRLELGSASKSGKGNIINLIQVDCDTIKDNGGDITFVLYSAISGTISFVLCFYFMGVSFFIFLAISVSFMVASFFLYKVSLRHQEILLKLKDERIAILKNVFKNLKFIKFHTFENLFLKIVYDKREREIRSLKIIFLLFVTVVFINWLCPNVSFMATITFVFTRKGVVSIATLITFYKLFEYVAMFFRILPYFFQLYFKFKLVDIRMKTFFQIRDADLGHIQQIQNTQSQFINPDDTFYEEDEARDRVDLPGEVAIQVVNGNFYYEDIGLQKIKQEDKDKEKKEKKKEEDKEDKEENKEKEEKNEQTVETKEESKETTNDPEKGNQSKFELQDINLDINAGELTFIIGKIGSGKTSLLYALLGEIQPKDDSTKILFSSDSIGYCPQKPFIQTKTVKENIAFYEPLDEGRLQKSIEMASLEEDLKLFANGVDSVLAEAGANISGGQKTRINLARCFYKERDIYLLDDPLSSLDFHVACRIIEKAIQGELKGKTRVIVTHSIQYLLYADKIIYLDEGRVKYSGGFPEFKKSQWYDELEKTIQKKEDEDTDELEETVEGNQSRGWSRRKWSRDSMESVDSAEKRFSRSRSRSAKREIDLISRNLERAREKRETKDSEEYQIEDIKRNTDTFRVTDAKSISGEEEPVDFEKVKPMTESETKRHFADNQYQSPLSDIKLSDSKIEEKYSKSKKETPIEEVKEEPESPEQKKPDFGGDEKQEAMIQKYFIEEDREKGRKLMDTFRIFMRYTSGPVVMVLLLAICVVNSFADYFCLNKLYDFIQNFEEEKKHIWTGLGYLYAYFLGPVSLVIIRTSVVSYCSIQASRDIHHDMMFSSLFGDLLGFHDRVETARLINRFSTDTDKMDKEILYKVSTFTLYTGFLISDVIIGMLTIDWWIVFVYLAYYLLVFYYQNMYVRFKKDLYRLEAVSRTPIVNLTNEMLDGKMVFKTLKKDAQCFEELSGLLEENTKNLTTQNALTNWFSIRISLFNIIIIQLVCFVFIWFGLRAQVITVQKVVIFLPFCLNFIWNIDFWINLLSQLETMLVSLERCVAFKNIPPERGFHNLKELRKRMNKRSLAKGKIQDFIRPFKTAADSDVPERTTSLSTGLDEPLLPKDGDYSAVNDIDNYDQLFDKGEVIFEDVDAQYPTKDNLALKGFNLHIQPAEKIGIVGQTGSGKSTVIKMLSQYLTHKRGSITIDGYDIRKMDLHVLRSQYLLLSQEVALFDGSIRENIYVEEIGNQRRKPRADSIKLGGYTLDDSEIIEQMIQFGFSREKLEKDGLDFKIINNGGNLSQGEQQLVALIKALYTRKKIIILDEATSNIDYHSEKMIMDFFYEKIKDQTLITVAHRINTVLRCDRIVVLEQGQIVEIGRTQELLKDKKSRFYSLYEKMTENLNK